jgi:hypothetical protein
MRVAASLGPATGTGRARQQPVDAPVGSVAEVALQLAPGRGESGPSMQMNHTRQVPGSIRARDVPIPTCGAASIRHQAVGFCVVMNHRDRSAPA